MAKLYFCPHCEKKQPATHFSCASGAKGGSAKGPSKARDSAKMKAAALKRWGKK